MNRLFIPVLLFLSALSIHSSPRPGIGYMGQPIVCGGTKLGWGKEKWRSTGELQFRVKDNMRTLDRWFVEGVKSYLPTKNWEFSLPIRFAVTPNHNEFRPGLGIIYKMYPKEKMQIAHQVLWQVDIQSSETKNGLRYALFYNHIVNEKILVNVVGGIFYRWENDFTGIQFLRAGGGLAYIIDEKHTLNFSYFVGATDTGQEWVYQGIPFLQLVINLNGKYEYVPAKYINF